jgi:hypothetical protein
LSSSLLLKTRPQLVSQVAVNYRADVAVSIVYEGFRGGCGTTSYVAKDSNQRVFIRENHANSSEKALDFVSGCAAEDPHFGIRRAEQHHRHSMDGAHKSFVGGADIEERELPLGGKSKRIAACNPLHGLIVTHGCTRSDCRTYQRCEEYATHA